MSGKTEKLQWHPAFCAATELELRQDLDVCKAVIKPEKIQEPIAENSAKYEKVYALYKKLYPAMKANFDELASLDV